MNEPAIALVFSPETWVERLHRHLADHGGARVRQIVLDPGLALDESYDALVVSHRWPGLTRPFVSAVRDRGRAVLGVFDPDEPAGRDHLTGLGVDGVVSADAPVAHFVDVIRELTATAPSTPGMPIDASARPDPAPAAIAPLVVTGIAGSGTSEIALGIAAYSRRRSTVLVDADEHTPSLAARLGLPVEPGLRDAIDAVEFGDGDARRTLVRVTRGFQVVTGFPTASAASMASAPEVLRVVEALGRAGNSVVVEVAMNGAGIAPPVLQAAGVLLVVAPATPIAVTRLLGWFAASTPLIAGRAVHIVFNRAPRDRFRRAELEHELVRTFTPASVWFVPPCRRVDDAAWRGALVSRGPFADAVGRIARATIVDARAPRTASPDRASIPRRAA